METQFLDGIDCYAKLEKQINEFIESAEFTAQAVRKYVLEVSGEQEC